MKIKVGVQRGLEEVALGLKSRRSLVLGAGDPRQSVGIAVWHHGGRAPALGTQVTGQVRVLLVTTGTGAVVEPSPAPLCSLGIGAG